MKVGWVISKVTRRATRVFLMGSFIPSISHELKVRIKTQ
jgi:hypothetical protein